MELNHVVTHVADYCAGEVSRYGFYTVRMERSGNETKAVATDGRRMIVASWPEKGNDLAFHLNAHTLETIKKSLSDKKDKLTPFEIDESSIKDSLSVKHQSGISMTLPVEQDVCFPKFADVIPTEFVFEVGFDLSRLVDSLTTLKKMSHDTVKLSFASANRAMKITAMGGPVSTLAVIMPTKLD